jgi:ElaB/YqjD/DUF883 family membrane-anchored ribosome-binding protein
MATEIPTGARSADIQESLNAAKDGLRGAIDKGAEKASHFKDAAMDRASHLKDVAWDRGRTAFSAIEKTFDERPWMVLGGVFVGGIILGMMLRRR